VTVKSGVKDYSSIIERVTTFMRGGVGVGVFFDGGHYAGNSGKD